MKNYEEAKKCYDKALEYDSENSQTWSYIGEMYYKQGNYEEAISCYDKGLEYLEESG